MNDHSAIIGWVLGFLGIAQAAVLFFLNMGNSKLSKIEESIQAHLLDRHAHGMNGVPRIEIDQRLESLCLVINALRVDTQRWFEQQHEETMPRVEVESRLRSIEVLVNSLLSEARRKKVVT